MIRCPRSKHLMDAEGIAMLGHIAVSQKSICLVITLFLKVFACGYYTSLITMSQCDEVIVVTTMDQISVIASLADVPFRKHAYEICSDF